MPNYSWDQGLSAEVLFVSVLLMDLSEYWKTLEENFRKSLFPRFPKKLRNLQKKNPLAFFNIVKEPLLVQKQTTPQQKALDFSFNLAPWKWVWHYQEGVTMTCRTRTFFTPRAPMLFAAGGLGALLVMPRPLSGCQIKAEIKGFPLMYRLFLYYYWFFQNIEKGWHTWPERILGSKSSE